MESTTDRDAGEDADGRLRRSGEAATERGRGARPHSIPEGVVDDIVVSLESGEPVVREQVVAEARVRLATVDLPSAELVAESLLDYCVAVRER